MSVTGIDPKLERWKFSASYRDGMVEMRRAPYSGGTNGQRFAACVPLSPDPNDIIRAVNVCFDTLMKTDRQAVMTVGTKVREKGCGSKRRSGIVNMVDRGNQIVRVGDGVTDGVYSSPEVWEPES